MTYLDYFELTCEPFSNAPVSRFYYNSSQHAQALTRLMHGAQYMKGLSILVGDIGAGKTTLARRMLDALPESEYEAALLVIIHSGITAQWLLRRIALQLGVESPAQEKLALLSQLYQRLLQIYESGKKAVVLIDEAQMLETREIMEEFRGLLNLEVPERKLISFVFFGLPEIEANLKLDPPLAQRVAMRYRLEPFTAQSTDEYIRHRLRLAGCPRMPFTPEAVEAIHRLSCGTPRVINTLCDNALFEAFLARTPQMDAALLEQIGANLGLLPNRDLLLAQQQRREAGAGVEGAGGSEDAAGSAASAVAGGVAAAAGQGDGLAGAQHGDPGRNGGPAGHPVASASGVPQTGQAARGQLPPRRNGGRIDLAEIDRYLEGLGKLST